MLLAALLLAVALTLTIGSPDPLLLWGCEMALFALAGWAALRRARRFTGGPARRLPPLTLPVAAIGLWGFVQLAFGWTVYRWATLDAALQNLALAAVFLTAYRGFRGSTSRSASHAAGRAAFLDRFLWFSVIVSVVSVLAYWTSPGKILWVFPAQYPDNWGPFPSRNNFAQFLELGFPIALVKLRDRSWRWDAAAPVAIILGAGLASASRAGAAILLAEGAGALVLLRRSRSRKSRMTLRGLARLSAGFAVFAGLAAVAGAGVLLHRLAEPDPLQFRREILGSTVALLRAAPHTRLLTGYGLGSFAAVYPQFAVFDSGAAVEHAHDDWLEWTAEGGLLYLALWAAVAAWAVVPAIRSVWGLGVIAVFLHAVVDYPFARLGISIWVFLLLGALAHETQPQLRAPRSEKSAAPEPLCVGRNP